MQFTPYTSAAVSAAPASQHVVSNVNKTTTTTTETGSPLTQTQAVPMPPKMIRAKSSLVSRNVTIAGHRTSVRLEPEMWNGLAEVTRRECATMHEVCTIIGAHKPVGTSLTAAIRVFVMAYFRAAATEDGHNRAGHGPGGQLMMSLMRLKDQKK